MKMLFLLFFLSASSAAFSGDQISDDEYQKVHALFKDCYGEFYENSDKSERLSYGYCYRNIQNFLNMFTARLREHKYSSKDFKNIFSGLGLKVHYYNRTVSSKAMDCADVTRRFHFADDERPDLKQGWANHTYLVKYEDGNNKLEPMVYDPLYEPQVDFSTYFFNIVTFGYAEEEQKIQILEFSPENYLRLCNSQNYHEFKLPAIFSKFNPDIIFVNIGSPVTFARFSQNS